MTCAATGEKAAGSEDGLYDNPAYSNCRLYDNPAYSEGRISPSQQLQHQKESSEPVEVIYTQPLSPASEPASENQEPTASGSAEEGEDGEYHKVINPLYSSSSPQSSLKSSPDSSNDPYYATPSLSTTHSHIHT